MKETKEFITLFFRTFTKLQPNYGKMHSNSLYRTDTSVKA